MNTREQKILIRIYGAVSDIPLPIVGAATQSATVQAFIAYGKDMSQAKPVITSALYHVRIGEYNEAEQELSALERWIKMRQVQEWRDTFPFPTIEEANVSQAAEKGETGE